MALVNKAIRDLQRRKSVYDWMEPARVDAIHFPLDEYNARIPQEIIHQAIQNAGAQIQIPAPWNEHFRPITEDEVLALLTGTR